MLNCSASLAMSTSVLKALPDKLDIKRHSPSILYIFFHSQPIGMITRKDLAKFRVESKRGLVKVEQLNIEDK